MKSPSERFRLASSYAAEVKADKDKRKLYETLAMGTLSKWQSLAVKDYLLPPVITHSRIKHFPSANKFFVKFRQNGYCAFGN